MSELIEHLPFTTQEVIGAKARIGLIVLATDYTMEHEFRHIIDQAGVDIFHARIENEVTVTPDTLAAMGEKIPATLRLILPGDQLDVVAYGCTSASIVLGEETVFAAIDQVQPQAHKTTPVTAAFAAFDALNAKRIAVLTPYRQDVNAQVQAYIEKAGFQVPVFGSFNEDQDPTVAKIDQKSLEAGIGRLIENHDVDAVFVSCTSVRIAKAVASIERKIGLPVTSSNHAMAWHCLRLAGVEEAMPEWGKLYELGL